MTLEIRTVIIKEFRSRGKTIRAKEPLVLEPVEEDGFYVYRHKPIGLDCYVEKQIVLGRVALEIVLELALLWREYAKEEDTRLDPEARDVKVNLLSLFSEGE